MKNFNLEEILFETFGFASFRSPQKEIISSILLQKDVLAILPTGAGKSICYQLPAKIFNGLTIVISPLISLMQDQVAQIKDKIPAAYLNSFLTFYEQQQVAAQIENGKIKLLYVSPEKFITDNFVELIKKTKISLLAVDEAHCISQWGHDFRPSYLKIAEVFREIPRCPIAAFTATATPEVRSDIVEKLELQSPKIFVKGFYRPNIFIEVFNLKNRFEKLLDVIKQVEGSKIIYASTRRETEELNEKLIAKNISSLPYHAGMTNEERKSIQEFFINNKSEVIVATNAFGMGINKPDIRAVIHYGMSGSIESYYQEIGRAGRDGFKAFAYLIYSNSDRKIHEFFLSNAFPSRQTIIKFYERFNDFIGLKIGEESRKIISLDYKLINSILNENLSTQQIQSIISILERNDLIRFVSENDYLMIKILITYVNYNEIKSRLTTNEQILIETLFRKFGSSITQKLIKVNLLTIINLTDLLRTQIEEILEELDQSGIIEYKLITFNQGFYFTSPRIYSDQLPINFADLELHLARGIKRLNEMENFIFTNECRWKFILKYFGEDVSDNFSCENCDNCKSKKSIFDLSSINIEKEILKTIKEVNGKFGTNTIIDILRGSKSKKIMEYKLFNVSTYGFLSGIDKEKIKTKINELIVQDKIEKSPSLYPTLSITSKGLDELNNQQITEIKIEPKTTKSSTTVDLRKNLSLYDRLKNLRKKIASKFNQPENFVCPDDLLREISVVMPRTREEFRTISGMTEKIFLKCSNEMIEEINSFLSEAETSMDQNESKLPESVRITFNMIKNGMSLIEICEMRNLSETIVADHIISLIENNFDFDIRKIIPNEHIQLMEKVLKETESKFLPMIKSKLPEEISFAELRIYLKWREKSSILKKNLLIN